MSKVVKYKGGSEEVYDAVEYTLSFEITDEQFLTDCDDIDAVTYHIRKAATEFGKKLVEDGAFERKVYRNPERMTTVHELTIAVIKRKGQS